MLMYLRNTIYKVLDLDTNLSAKQLEITIENFTRY